ncbi:MAG: pyrroline-5-carboxylate reductase dimerization domain-containing protein, partial [Acidobacteriota bacterium]
AARERLFKLYDQLGTAVWLEGETHFDLVTALAGSGPGFVYRFIDALAEAASSGTAYVSPLPPPRRAL